MNSQRKIVTIFKKFIEKILLPQIKRTEGNLHEWTKLVTMVTSENPNYNEIQIYVERLPDYSTLPLFQKKRSDTTGKKKDPSYLTSSEDIEVLQNGFNSHKSFGSERHKTVSFHPHPFQLEDTRQPKIQIKEGSFQKDEQFKKIALNTNNNSPKPTNPVNQNPVLSSLDRLYRSLLQNQQKIQILTVNGYQFKTVQ